MAYLLRNGASVQEVQVEMKERIAGESYFNLKRAVEYMVRMCTVYCPDSVVPEKEGLDRVYHASYRVDCYIAFDFVVYSQKDPQSSVADRGFDFFGWLFPLRWSF